MEREKNNIMTGYYFDTYFDVYKENLETNERHLVETFDGCKDAADFRNEMNAMCEDGVRYVCGIRRVDHNGVVIENKIVLQKGQVNN